MVGTIALAGAALGAGSELLANQQKKKGLQDTLRRLARQKVSHRRSQSQQATSGHLDAMASAGNVAAEAKRGGPLTLGDHLEIQKSVDQADSTMARALARDATRRAGEIASERSRVQDKITEIPSAVSTVLKHAGNAALGAVGGMSGLPMQALGQKMSDIRMDKMMRAASFDPDKDYSDADLEDLSLAQKKLEMESARHLNKHYGRGD